MCLLKQVKKFKFNVHFNKKCNVTLINLVQRRKDVS